MEQQTQKLACVLDALGYQAIEDKDGYVNLSVADLQHIDDRMAMQLQAVKDIASTSNDKELEHSKQVADLQQRIDSLEAQTAKADEEHLKQVADLQRQIAQLTEANAALRQSPAAEPAKPAEETAAEAVDYAESRRLFDMING